MRIHLLLTTLLLALHLHAPLAAQGLLLTVAGGAAVTTTPDGQLTSDDVARFDLAGGTVPWLTRENIAAMMGDADGNGFFDDAPGAIDALALTPSFVTGDVTGVVLSLEQDTTFLGGVLVRDGDIVSLQADGTVLVVYAEATFSAATGTSTIDVDAFHIDPDGSLVFSFAQDETTSLTSLIAANGGDPSLDETCVFRLSPGQSEAALLYSRSDILGFVNTALGTSLSTVVDTTGMTADPGHPGEYWLALGSAQSSVEGFVISTANGGELAMLSGVSLDSATFGFGEQEILGALCLTGAGTSARLVLHHPATTGAPSGFATFRVDGASPGAPVFLLAAQAAFPGPTTTAFPQLGTPGLVYLRLDDPLLNLTFANLDFRRFANAAGQATFTYDVTTVPPGLSIYFQAIDASVPAVTLPIVAQN